MPRIVMFLLWVPFLCFAAEMTLPEGTVAPVPLTANGVANKAYVDSSVSTCATQAEVDDLRAQLNVLIKAQIKSCEDRALLYPDMTDGIYNITVNNNFVEGYCEKFDGQWWLVILNYYHIANGAEVDLNFLTASLPQYSPHALLTTPRNIAEEGHVAPEFLNTMSFSEMRFKCISSTSRSLHFKTSHSGTLSYAKTGSGSMTGIGSSYSGLTGDEGRLPATSNAYYSNYGKRALVSYPMYISASEHHWAIGQLADGGAVYYYSCNDSDDLHADVGYHWIVYVR